METYQDKNTSLHPNYFVDPCNCTGSMKFVHIKCIAFWINSKDLSQVVSCSHCKKPFPQFIEVCRIDENNKKNYRYFRLIGNNNTPYIYIEDMRYQLFTHQQLSIGTNDRCDYTFLGAIK